VEGNFEKPVRKFIVDNFLFGEDNGMAADASFLENGVIDSTGVLELIAFIEQTFGIRVEDDEIVPENLDSIQNVCSFLDRKLSNPPAGSTRQTEAAQPATLLSGTTSIV
jgi:acyl carrier protein